MRKKEESNPGLLWNEAIGCVDWKKPPSEGTRIVDVEEGWY
jgi:hypothetical protein